VQSVMQLAIQFRAESYRGDLVDITQTRLPGHRQAGICTRDRCCFH
jgi:hypothetical protein